MLSWNLERGKSWLLKDTNTRVFERLDWDGIHRLEGGWSLVSRDDVDVLRSFQVEEQGIS
jgi:hypothetical protein